LLPQRVNGRTKDPVVCDLDAHLAFVKADQE